MIVQPLQLRQQASWQLALAHSIRDPEELLKELDIPLASIPAIDISKSFPLCVPRDYVRRMRKGDPDDPLLRQVLPLADERLEVAGFTQDPVGDLAALGFPGILQKYQGRVLLICTGACAIHCRYCFRRHFPYTSARPRSAEWQQTVDSIAADPSLSEVILSGGDPLSMGDQYLSQLVKKIEQIPHIKRLRIHTRLPIVLPERVDDALLNWLQTSSLQRVMVVHINHANEIDEQVQRALRNIRDTGTVLLNQSVLLRGINDNSPALAALSEALFECDILPYYLHLLDRVKGAAHFEVHEDKARQLYRELQQQLPGYLVPRLVREDTGKSSKTLII